ncbi:MAG TPA: WD40 repeat domain-containing protein [Pyrinomonadaceae bacterium]|nr:WD40 repeat domain-containing protein [Pyrinomonadaceae bacterium]
MQLNVQTTSSAGVQSTPIEPYVGPRSFSKDQRAFFFGRDEEADELVSIITAHQAVLLHSQSGAGKTSLVNAKLIPKLEEEESFHVLPPMRVQGQLPANLKVGKTTNIFVLNALMSCGQFDVTKANVPMTFHEFVAQCGQHTNQYGEPSPTVMIFDQFEELFTSYPGRWADREEFFRQIGEALEGNPKKGLSGYPLLRVVFSMREDYIAELDPYLPLLPEKLRTRFRLEHLREKKALTAIKSPLEKTNRSFAPGVAEQLVKNLLRMPTRSITGTQTMGLYVEPVQLQVVCQSLWDALTPEETVITAKHLQTYGDVSQALSNFYERSIRSVSTETSVKEETLRRWFGDTLITLEGTRAPVNRGKDTTGGMPNAAIDKLETLRLIKGEWKGTNARWYELAHDRFIEPIRRSNDKWLATQSRTEQIRLRLEAKASKWQPGSKLLEAEELLEAQRLVRNGLASPSLRGLVDTSRAGAQKKRIRLLRLGIAVTSIALVVFVIVALFAWKKSNDASLAEKRAKSRLLAIRAGMALAADAELSVLLGKEALQLADTDAARNVIRAGLLSLSDVGGALKDHGANVASAEFSKSGQFIVTVTRDGKVRLWDAGTKKVVKDLSESVTSNAATFSPDGSLIATAGTDGVVRIWDGTNGAPLRELKGHTGQVHRAMFSPDGKYLVSVSDDSTARLWNPATGETVRVLSGHTAPISEVAFSSDNIHFATEAADETAMIWNVGSDTGLVLTGLTGTKGALAFSPDGKLLATEGGPGTELGALPTGDYPATVWDVATGKVKATLGGHQDTIVGVSFSPDGNALVTSSGDGTARLWTAGGQLVQELRGHSKALAGAVFSPDGKFVVTASADNTVRVWDSLDGKMIAQFRGHSQAVNSVAFSSDSKFMVTASDDQTARLWPFHPGEGGSNPIESRGHSAAVTSIACSPNGSELAGTTRDGKLWLDGLGLQFFEPFSYLVDRSAKVANARFSPDGQSIATTRGAAGVIYNIDTLRAFVDSTRSEFIYRDAMPAPADKKVKIAEPESVTLEGHTGDINSVAFSPDGRSVVTASADGTARVWDAATGKSLGELRGHSGSVNSASFSPDGKFIVTAGDDATVRLWDAARFAQVNTIGGTYPMPVVSAEFSPEGRFIVAASGEAAWVCDPNRGNVVRTLEGHTGRVNSASFSPDSRLIVTASADNTARIWNVETGQSIATLLEHTGPVLNALFSPDGKSVFTASEDYATRIYPREAFAPFEEVRALISKRVARELTQKEREDYLKEPENR